MSDFRCLPGLLLLIFLFTSCQESTALRAPREPEQPPPARPQQQPQHTEKIENIFTHKALLSYQGYTVTKLRKKVNIEGIKTEVSYAVLRKEERVVAVFDGLYHPMGNTTEFGLFSLIGGETKQFIVEQAIPRNWSHWIIKLVPDFKGIFDSRRWKVDGELTLVDVNQDGVFEIRKLLTTFYDFHKLPTSEAPLIDLLFTYDSNTEQYIPANQIFQDYALKGIEDEVRSLQPNDERKYLSSVIHIVLRYIYAGKREEGWSFYDKEYNLANKNLVKSDVLNRLRSEPVYKFLYDRDRRAKN